MTTKESMKMAIEVEDFVKFFVCLRNSKMNNLDKSNFKVNFGLSEGIFSGFDYLYLIIEVNKT